MKPTYGYFIDAYWQPTCRLTLMLALTVCCLTQPALCAPSRFTVYEAGLRLLQDGQYEQAGTLWQLTAEQLQRQASDQAAIKQRAFAYLLATIAFDKAQDIRAYQSWGQVIQHYLTANTSWEVEQHNLKEQLVRLRTELRGAHNANIGPPIVVSQDERLLMELERALSFTTYHGPKSGLRRKVLDGQTENAITTVRDYYPRPLAIIDDEQAPLAGLSKYTAEDEPTSPPPARTDPKMQWIVRPLTDTDDATTSPIVSSESSVEASVPPVPRVTQASPLRRTTTPESLTNPTPDIPSKNPGLAPSFSPRSAPSAAGNVLPRRGMAPAPDLPLTVDETRDSPSVPTVSSPLTPVSLSSSRLQALALPELPQEATRSFSDAEKAIAQTAWQYFAANHQSTTGMFNSVHGYPYTTLWDIGSSLAGLVAAEQLDLTSPADFAQDMSRLLTTLSQLPLYNQELPNREYHTQTGKMVDLTNRPSSRGSGWPALDIGRLLIWLKIIAVWYPNLTQQVEQVVKRWNFERLTINDELNSLMVQDGHENLRQEGRLGYEQYAAMGLQLWGIHLSNALDYDHVAYVDILGVTLPFDTRNLAFLTSEPFFLTKIELDRIDDDFERIVQSVYHVQKVHWQQSSVLTVVSEDSIDQKPWFVYNTIYGQHKPWACLSPNGTVHPDRKTLSTKAAFAWFAIYQDAYTKALYTKVQALTHPTRGYYAGIYENGRTNRSSNINTNAVILEAMLYVHRGSRPFLALHPQQ